MPIFTKYSQFAPSSINLVGIDTHLVAVMVQNNFPFSPFIKKNLRYKENRQFF